MPKECAELNAGLGHKVICHDLKWHNGEEDPSSTSPASLYDAVEIHTHGLPLPSACILLRKVARSWPFGSRP